MSLLRQKAWLIVLVGLLVGALATVSAIALRPTRDMARVSLPPLPETVQPGPDPTPDPEGLPTNAGLLAETIRVLGLGMEVSELDDRVDADFEPDTRILEITVTRIPRRRDAPIADRLAARTAEGWTASIDSVRAHYETAENRRDLLERHTRRIERQLADAPPGDSGQLLAGLAAAEAEIGRIDARLFQIGAPTSADAFVLQKAEELSPWTLGYALPAFAGGAAIGALLAIIGLVVYSRRRESLASTAS